MTDFQNHFRGYQHEMRHRLKHLHKNSDEDENSRSVDPKSRLNHRINPIIEIELSEETSQQDPHARPIDYGIIECLIPLYYCLAFTTLTGETELFVGSVISIIVLYTKFYDWIPNIVRTIWVILICIAVSYYQFYRCAAMLAMTYFPFHLLLSEYSGSFNFVELFALLNLNATFIIYWIEKWVDFTWITRDLTGEYDTKLELLLKVRPHTTGYLPEILLFFSPYVILNIAAMIFTISMLVTKRRTEHYIFSIFLLSIFIMLAIVFVSNWISPFSFSVPLFLWHQFLLVVKSKWFIYMLVSLPVCLCLINRVCGGSDTFVVRKLFHFTAFVVFLPAVLYNQKVMVFGSNIFIVLFIVVEFSKKYAKGSHSILEKIHQYEDQYLDEREKTDTQLVLSHLFLLLGCCVPTITSYILIDGNEFTPHFVYFSLSGLIFVGIGDAMAALGGRKYGSAKWPNRNKSQQGSFFCLGSYLLFYVAICLATQPLLVAGKGIEMLFAGFIATMVEAYTRQFDNFLCPQICFACIILFNYYFEEYLGKYHIK